MRKMKYVVIALVVLWSYLLFDSIMGLATSIEVRAEEPLKLQRYEMKATAYCLTGKTASGEYVREGIVASKPEWIGKKMKVYLKDSEGKQGEYLGTFDVADTGGETIKSGKVLDVWIRDYQEAKAFGCKDVVVYLID